MTYGQQPQGYAYGQQGGYGQQQGYRYGQPQQPPQQVDLGSLDDFGLGGGRSFFNANSQPGATVTGTVTSVELTQYHDFQTKMPGYWKDGKPQLQMHIVIETDLREDAEDDGMRSIWIKGWGAQGRAFREARRLNGGKQVAKGDQFTATFTGYEPNAQPGKQPAKLYRYEIKPGNSPAVNAFGAPTQPQQPVQQYGQPAPQQATQQAPQSGYGQPHGLDPMQVHQLKSAGKTPQEIAQLLGGTVEQVFAITDAASPSMHTGSETAATVSTGEPEF